jgi:hypothetical protein
VAKKRGGRVKAPQWPAGHDARQQAGYREPAGEQKVCDNTGIINRIKPAKLDKKQKINVKTNKNKI